MRLRFVTSLAVLSLGLGMLAVGGCSSGGDLFGDAATGSGGAGTGAGATTGTSQGGMGASTTSSSQGGSAGAGGTPVTCGDGDVDAGEDCDGDDLAGATCVDLGYSMPGELGCNASCGYDASGCKTSCDGALLEPGEQCDGFDLGSNSCQDFGFSSPAGLTCDESCMPNAEGCMATCDGALLEPGEECDGAFLNNLSCTDFGYVEPGGLSCTDCAPNAENCTAVCGNMTVEPGEACDDGNNDPTDGCDNCNSGGITCADALPISLMAGSAVANGTTVGGGQHNGSSCSNAGNSPDRIYAVTPTQSGFMTASLNRATTDYDSILYILTDCTNPNSDLWCADSWLNQNPQVGGGEAISVQVQAGTTYYVVVDGFNGAAGNYELTLDLSAGTCSDPVPFPLWQTADNSGMSGLGATTGMPNSHNTTSCGGSLSGEVIYEVQPQYTALVDVRLPNGDSNYNTVLSARSDCAVEATELDCDTGNGSENFNVPVTQGQPLYVLVDGWNGATGEYRLRLKDQ